MRYASKNMRNKLVYCNQEFNKKTVWSYRLKECLNQIEEDFILSGPVDYQEIDKCVNRMEINKQIACFNFKPSCGFSITDAFDRYELKDSKAPFRINLQVALWRKDYLIRFIRDYGNPWQFETWGSVRSRRFKDEIYHLKEDAS